MSILTKVNGTSKKLKSISLILLASIAIVSCKKDRKIEIEKPTAQEFGALQENAIANIKQDFTFKAEDGVAKFTSAKGVEITISGGCLSKNGNPVTGNVNLEFVEVFDGGSMLVTNKTTMGKTADGKMAMLISGGEFFIKASQDGVPLTTACPISLKIPANLTGDIQPDMILWTGVKDDDGNIDWEQQKDGANGKDRVFGEGTGNTAAYYATLSNFGWTNVDKFYSDPRPKTTILASAPEGYDATNSAIYLHYDGQGSSLAKLDTYDTATGLFSEHYGQIPIGLQCHIIFATEDNGNWRYAIKPVTIAANAVYNFTLAETNVVTEAQMVAAINALP